MSTETKIYQRIEDDYSEDLRWGDISPATWSTLKPLLYPFYLHQETISECANKAAFAISILEDVAMGSRKGTVIHGDKYDFTILATQLQNYYSTLRIGSIICPDWGWHIAGETLVYDMNKLASGVPKTAEKVISYITLLAQRATLHQRNVTFNTYFPAWELTRTTHLPDINAGISSAQALQLLYQTSQATSDSLTALDNDYFKTTVTVLDLPTFHNQAEILSQALLDAKRGLVRSVQSARKDFYNGNLPLAVAALELAEAKLGFRLIAKENDIVLVCTSPTIARACLGGSDIAWIQLNHGYRG